MAWAKLVVILAIAAGVMWQRRDALVALINTSNSAVDPRCVAINRLGLDAFADGRPREYEGQMRSALDLFAKAAECDSQYARAWLNVGHGLHSTPDRTVTVGGKEVGRVKAYVNALLADPNSGEAMVSLASVMQHAARVTVDGRRMGRLELSARGLEVAPTQWLGWLNLPMIMDAEKVTSVTIGRQQWSKAEIAQRAVELNPDSADAVGNLGFYLGDDEVGYVKRERMSKVEVLALAASMNRESEFAWSQLSLALAHSGQREFAMAGTTYEAGYALQRMIEVSKNRSEAWAKFGAAMRPSGAITSLQGTTFKRADAFWKAVRTDQKSVTGWGSLCADIPVRGSVTLFDGRVLSRRTCYERVLKLTPHLASSWNNLGTELGPDGVLVYDGKAMPSGEVYRRALELDPKLAVAWDNLGRVTPAFAEVTVSGRSYTKTQCHAQAIEVDPDFSEAWNNLALSLDPGAEYTVLGVVMSRDEIFEERHRRGQKA